MFSRHHSDKLIYPLLVAALLMAISYRPKYHLQPDMPGEFYTASSSDSPQKRDEQKKIALAYWQAAQMNIQWKFAYGHPLPNDVPAEFSVGGNALGRAASDPAVRSLYWRRLQQVWFVPEAWKKQYEWDWSWASDPMTAGAEWLRDSFDRWFAMHGPR
jgi:hypothetical protein